jgi:hypothetical protein
MPLDGLRELAYAERNEFSPTTVLLTSGCLGSAVHSASWPKL